jgi:dihydroflavonol-4-reductase
MPRIEPIPLDELAEEPRRIIEDGVANGTYATPIPLQIFAYRTNQILMTNAARSSWGQQTLLGGRILELIRIRSAQLGECQPCMQSRKHDSISDEDVACLVSPGHSALTKQERLAVQFLDLLSADHHAIDDETYRELGSLYGRTNHRARLHVRQCHGSASIHPHPRCIRGQPTGDRLRPEPGRLRHHRRPGRSPRMSQTVFVTGATGLAGANVCRLLVERGDRVRALARATADTDPLVALGVEVVAGDVTDAQDVFRGATGSDAAIHCAALLGGASQNLPDFEAVNVQGTKNVLDAAERLGLRRVVAVSTGTFFDTSGGLDREDAPVSKEPSSDPYTVTKMAAFQDAMARAEAGQDVVSTHPGAIFGPSPVASNALGKTSFNRVLVSALRQRITQYLKFPVSWVYSDDVARGCILALDRGVSGERYMLDGRPEDVTSIAHACSRICELAGLGHRVEDVPPSDDPELARVFGPTLVAIAAKAASARPAQRDLTDTKTYKRLGYDPISLDDGLQNTTDWLRAIGKITS